MEMAEEDEQSKDLLPKLRIQRQVSIQKSPRRKLMRKQTLFMIDQVDLNRFNNWSKKMIGHSAGQVQLIDNFIQIFASIRLKHSRHLIDIYSECATIDDPQLLIRWTYFISYYFIEVGDQNKATYFIRQAFILADTLQFYTERCLILILSAKICRILKMYEIALSLLLDSLAYSWYDKNNENELQTYEAIGLNLYHQQQPLQATEFHNRFVNGVLESSDSILFRNTTQNIILLEQQAKNNYERQPYINQSTLNRINLPFQDKVKQTYIKVYDFFDGQESLRQMGNQIAKILTLPQLLSVWKCIRRNPNHFLYQGNSPSMAIPQRILDIKRKKQEYIDKFRDRRYSEQKVLEYDQVIRRVQQSVKHTQYLLNESGNSVYINQKEEIPPIRKIVNRMKCVFEQIILK